MKPTSIKINPLPSSNEPNGRAALTKSEPTSEGTAQARRRSEDLASPVRTKSEPTSKEEVGQLSVDIYHTNGELVVLAPIAGICKENITLSLTDDVLVIRGARPSKEEIPEENYYTRECFWGNFSRAIVLPEEADTKNVTATFDNNVLEIRIPKGQVEHTKIIRIKA